MLAIFVTVLFQLTAVTARTTPSDTTAVRSTAGASAELLHHPMVLEFCRLLLRNAASDQYREQGAFVVQSRGMLFLVAWPRGGEKEILRWYGRFPAGTLAIIHTHPAWQSRPSQLDMRAARGAGLPVYVITPFAISKTTGGRSETVVEGDWSR